MQPLLWHISNIHNPNHFVSFPMHDLFLSVLLKLTKESLFTTTSFKHAPSFLSFSYSSPFNFSCFFFFFLHIFESCHLLQALHTNENIKKRVKLGNALRCIFEFDLVFFLLSCLCFIILTLPCWLVKKHKVFIP